MINKLKKKNIETYIYPIARSCFALSTILLLLFNDINELIPLNYYNSNKQFFFHSKWNLFFLFEYDSLVYAKVTACFILILVIIGRYPILTGLLHFWVTFSVFYSVMAIEGGDQIALIVTAFLLPISLADNRKSMWSEEELFPQALPNIISYFCYSCLLIVRVQISLLYLDAGVEKLRVSEWLDGSATYYWFNHGLFGAPEWMKLIFGWLFVRSFTVTFITWGVISLEVLLFAALFMKNQYKIYLFCVAITFHFFIFLVHGLPNFFLNMAGCLMLYLLPVELPFSKNTKLQLQTQ